MRMPLAVSREGVARFLLHAQHLNSAAAPGRAGRVSPIVTLRKIRRLECVQIDPVAVVERNQHLVLAARLPGYDPGSLEALLRRGRVFEYWANAACIIPIEAFPVFEGTRRRFRNRLGPELRTLRPIVRRMMAALESLGPLPARGFASPERLRGAWDLSEARTKATSHALTLLFRTGALVVAKRDRAERYFDLPERAIPAGLRRDAAAMKTADADDAMLEMYLHAYRVFDAGDPRFGWRAMTTAGRRDAVQRRVRDGSIVPLTIGGVARQYFVLARDVPALRRHERAAAEDDDDAGSPARFLPPLDNLLWRRERIADVFGFRYLWEGYLPVARRRYGHYAMPILVGSRLVGRIDPRLDRARGRLVVRLLHLEPHVAITRGLRESLAVGLEAFARFHGAGDVEVERTHPAGLRV